MKRLCRYDGYLYIEKGELCVNVVSHLSGVRGSRTDKSLVDDVVGLIIFQCFDTIAQQEWIWHLETVSKHSQTFCFAEQSQPEANVDCCSYRN